MRHEDKTAARAKLEQLCARWAALGPEDQGRKLDVENEIFLLVYQLFPGRESEIGTVFLKDWKHFDPAKGPAYGFFSARISLRQKDAYRDQKVYEDHTVADTAQPDDGRGESLLEGLPAGAGADPGERLDLDDTACEFLSVILDLRSHLQGRANNPTRHNYFRMFFTDSVAAGLHDGPPPPVFVKRERDLFTALKLEFLDFFMEENCRSVADICRSPLKPYGALVEGRSMEETKLPLPGDVYVSYLSRMENTRVNVSAVSQQRQIYREELKKWLGIQD